MNRVILFLAMLCPALVFAAAPQKPFELRDGDRVVFIGDALIEREQHYGYVELMMTLRWPDRNVTFRNLGWSADTPVGQSRVSFDWNKGEAEWFKQLVEQIKQTQPTVVVLGYGMANSLEDAAARATEEITRLASGESRAASPLSPLRGEGGTTRLDKFTRDYEKLIDAILELNKETRFILLSPIRHEKLPPPMPDPARHNEFLASYTKAIQGVAEKRGYHFVNVFNDIEHAMASKGPLTDNGIHLSDLGYNHLAHSIARGLDWKGFEPRLADYADLRQAIIKKNRTFFHRWRPQNSTYLFLFRKHEQGKNAQEIPQFDPLVAAEEEKIAKLRREPAKQTPPQAFAHKPKQNPLPEKPQTPFKPQPKPEFTLADPNLEISLWAENPLLAKPIQMNWDARGRLWIASSSVYPQIAPGQEEEDKILIIEDTDNDGKADKTTVFADGLLIPTAVEPGDGGAYVGQSTELLHFKDTDGDGIADERRVVLSGFGTEDTHHTLHTLRWGPDGQLNMNQSIYIHSHIETPHGVVRLNSGGTLQLRPDTLELGVLMKGLVNGWGHAIDDFGQSFQTDGAGGQGINWTVPQAMYVTYAGARRILGSVSPGSYPKFCGLEIIKSEHFPKDWQGGFVTCDFRANRLVRFSIDDAGAAYVTKQHEFLRTTNITFRPIDVKLGPDGALYIADWSNPIIQHGEVDFRDPRRDREHGRIWRVSYKGGKEVICSSD
jgi:glucose/arabinose dehydrogenase/lysophospholipase L1-like esterase